MPTTTRSRYEMIGGSRNGIQRQYHNGALVSESSLLTQGGRFQRKWSESHPVRLLGRTSRDIGGNFRVQSSTRLNGRTFVRASSGSTLVSTVYEYTGPLSAYDRLEIPTSSDLILGSSDSVMDAFGTRAIARSLPTNPLAGMGQFLGELRDLPKAVDFAGWRDISADFVKRTNKYKYSDVSSKAAGEYLNQVFGWMPFVKDLKDAAKVIKHQAKHVQQYARNSGRDVRRTYKFPTESNTVGPTLQSSSFPGSPPLASALYTKQGKLYVTTETVTERWFSGAFTYYLPPALSEDHDWKRLYNKARIAEAYANRLYGLRLTPSLVYKLTPWSWALDWVSTTGDVIHNWSAFANDGLVMRYGYIMEKKTVTKTYTLADLQFVGQGPTTVTDVYIDEVKTRRRATPYGFGILPTSFSAKQWSIIAALGISRQPRSLSQ